LASALDLAVDRGGVHQTAAAGKFAFVVRDARRAMTPVMWGRFPYVACMMLAIVGLMCGLDGR
jgi:hypothetical protein